MRHHGIGPKSAQAICVPLVVGSFEILILYNDTISFASFVQNDIVFLNNVDRLC